MARCKRNLIINKIAFGVFGLASACIFMGITTGFCFAAMHIQNSLLSQAIITLTPIGIISTIVTWNLHTYIGSKLYNYLSSRFDLTNYNNPEILEEIKEDFTHLEMPKFFDKHRHKIPGLIKYGIIPSDKQNLFREIFKNYTENKNLSQRYQNIPGHEKYLIPKQNIELLKIQWEELKKNCSLYVPDF